MGSIRGSAEIAGANSIDSRKMRPPSHGSEELDFALHA
jgi:hypothetical protein